MNKLLIILVCLCGCAENEPIKLKPAPTLNESQKPNGWIEPVEVMVLEGVVLERRPDGSWWHQRSNVPAMFIEIGDKKILSVTLREIDGQMFEYSPKSKEWKQSFRTRPVPSPFDENNFVK